MPRRGLFGFFDKRRDAAALASKYPGFLSSSTYPDSLEVPESSATRNRIIIPDKERKRVRPGIVSPESYLPGNVRRPTYAKLVNARGAPETPLESQVHNEEGRKAMRDVCLFAAQALEFAGTLVAPGVTTDKIDQEVHKMILKGGGYPSPLRYQKFPKSICTSVNDVVCHGIPDSRPLEDGDIINIDVTVYKNGYHGDTSKTFLCGEVDDELKQLVEVTRECLSMAIAICGPGVEYKRIGQTIHDIADTYKYGVIKDFLGHGIGKFFHSAPAIIPYRNKLTGRMLVGETFTIEPILTTGGIKYKIWNDGWTAVTTDGSYTAQFEHTVLIAETGVEILTLPL